MKIRVRLSFILGKSRVAPLKQITIPRLELAAAVLAVRIDKMLKKKLQLDLDKSMFFADRQTVLKYIANHTKRLHTFVVNKVSVIRDTTEVVQWRHIGTKLNPADDDASRGMSIEHFLKSSRWIQCPNFLLETSEEWPQLLLFQTFLTMLLINSLMRVELMSKLEGFELDSMGKVLNQMIFLKQNQ